MATSVYEGVITFNENDIDVQDTLGAEWGHTIASNLQHLADQAGQVRACWRAVSDDSAGLTYAGARFLNNPTPSPTTDPDPFSPSFIWKTGPFVPVLKPDGTPYPMRLQVAGTSVSTEEDLIVVYAAYNRVLHRPLASQAYASPVPRQVAVFTSVSITNVWEEPQVINLTAVDANDARTNAVSTIDSIGGDPQSMRVPLMQLSVWGSNGYWGGTEQRLTGVYAAEYIGL